MKNSKIISFFLFLVLVMVLNTGCIFPDTLPKLKELKAYSPTKIEYGKTTLEDFKKLISKLSTSDTEVYQDGLTIIKTQPASSNTYNLIRIGFKDDKLDWTEFNLARNIKINKFTEFYGKPANIDTTYDPNLDYYNYNFFNISADKTTKYAKTITFFGKNQPAQTVKKPPTASAKKEISYTKKMKFYQKFPNIIPGITMESDFLQTYPNLQAYNEDKNGTANVYVFSDELGEAGYYYDKAVLKFQNGLLVWVNLIPKNLPLSECLKILKISYKKESVNTDYDLYDFTGFILIVDKKTNLVQSIGIFKEGIKL